MKTTLRQANSLGGFSGALLREKIFKKQGVLATKDAVIWLLFFAAFLILGLIIVTNNILAGALLMRNGLLAFIAVAILTALTFGWTIVLYVMHLKVISWEQRAILQVAMDKADEEVEV